MQKQTKIKDIISKNIKVKKDILSDIDLLNKIEILSNIIFEKLHLGGKILLAGNGGSAADAQHIAAEFVGRFEKERPSLAAMSLATDTSILTAISNDYNYEDIFSRQISGLGKPNDIFIGLTTSGTSKNILKAIKEANKKNISTAVLCGSYKEKLAEKVDHLLSIPSSSTARIQECHIMILHIICSLIEENF